VGSATPGHVVLEAAGLVEDVETDLDLSAIAA